MWPGPSVTARTYCSAVGDYRFDAELWQWDATETAWFFLTVPGDVSDDIEARTVDQTRGFGSVRVEVTIGATTWRTSVFPDSKQEAYVLPVKRAVRAAEELGEGTTAAVELSVLD